MKNLLNSNIGRLRIIAYLEGVTLLILVFVAVPIKYYWGNPEFTKILGPIHGAFFLLFVMNTVSVSIEQAWKFKKITWKVLVACMIPFGTFYVDRKFLSNLNH